MLSKPPSCVGCPLHTLGVGFMEPSGSGHYGVMLIGEALGKDEAEEGRPFVGAAGRLLQEAIDWAGLDRDGFIIANAVWCRPPDNKLEGEDYEEQATTHCYRAHLGPLIAAKQPKVLVPLGNVPLNVLLGFKGILKARGYVYRRGNQLVLPSIHPSYIQRGNTKWIQVLVHDLQRAVEVARTGWNPASTQYVLDPSVAEAERWATAAIASGQPIAFDIETPGKDAKEEDEVDAGDVADEIKPIIRIGFSYGPYNALSLSWAKRNHPVVRRLLESPSDKIVWNAQFDVPHLHAAGFDINGTIHDGMIAWHILHSDLPKGLGFVATMLTPEQPAWKYLSRELPAYYNATDAAVEWLATIRAWEWLKKTGLWRVYERHVLQLDRIFARMSAAGMPVDLSIRAEKSLQLTQMLGELNAKVQEVVPAEVCPHHPKTGYKRLAPDDPTDRAWVRLDSGLWARRLPFVPSAGENGGVARYQNHLGQTPIYRKGKRSIDEQSVQLLRLRYPDDQLYPLILDRAEVVKLGGTYIGWTKGERLLSEELCGADQRPDVSSPRPGDPEAGVAALRGILPAVGEPSGEERNLPRISGGLRVGRDGRIHPTFTHNPSTLRTSCVAPNLQNIPRAAGLGRTVKEIFVAPGDNLFVEVDYSGIEALLVGLFADSGRYMRLARLGVHDYANAYALWQIDGVLTEADMPSLEWSDADLGAALKSFKLRFPAERDVRKRMVHGRNYLMGWKEAQNVLLKEQGRVVAAADIKKFLGFYDELFPEITTWQQTLLRIVGGVREDGQGRVGISNQPEDLSADVQVSLPHRLGATSAGSGWVRNPYGYLHRYNRAVEWERVGGAWQYKPGADAKRLIAFLPQSTAAAVGKEALIRCAEDPEVLEALRLFIHDSIIGETHKDRAEWLKARLSEIMTQPNPELDGLVVGVEGKVGKVWASLK